MPQLDPTYFATQLFWLTVTFVLLYVALAKYILPRIHYILESRKDRIDHDLGLAAQMKDEAEHTKTGYEKVLSEARVKAQAVIATSGQEADKAAAASLLELDKAVAEKIAKSEAEIAAARKEVLSNLAPVAQELATNIVEKLVHVKPSPDKVSAVVGQITKQKQA